MTIGSVSAALWLASTAATGAMSDGECAWLKLPQTARQEYVIAFQRSIEDGSKILRRHDPEIRSSFQACAGRSDVPQSWVVGAVGSQAIQAGAVEALREDGISASKLDAAWRAAPEAARECTRANAAKMFGINNRICADRTAPMTFLEILGISPTGNRKAAIHALYYFNAKAQSGWADSLITRLKSER